MAELHEWLLRSIPLLRRRFLDHGRRVPAGLVEALERDPRASARALAHRIRARRSENRSEGQRLRNLLRFEGELWAAGHRHVAGIDEAGMAPLAGPVVAAAAILPRRYKLRGLDDSKVVEPDRRVELAERIRADAVAWAIGIAEVEEVDRLNIYHAGLLAMRRAVEALAVSPDYCLVDARKIPGCPCPQRGIVRGDSLSASIAAASILAKTTRDSLMTALDATYPGYGFAEHKGYPTPHHCRTLKRLGASPIHRRSFARVRAVLGLPPLNPAGAPRARRGRAAAPSGQART